MIPEIARGVLLLVSDLIALLCSGEADAAEFRARVAARLTEALAWLSGLQAIHAADWRP